MAEGWYRKWRPTGMDEVRRTVDAAASQVPPAEHPELGPPPAQATARIEQDNYEAIERAREEGRQEALNKDQFKEGWDAGQEAIKRQNAAKRKMGMRTSTAGVRRSTPPRRFKTSGSVSKSTRNSAASAFKRRR